MDAALPVSSKPATETRPATFGTASLVFAVLTIVLPVVVFIYFGQKAAQEDQVRDIHGWGGLAAFLASVILSVIVSGVSSLVGTITGVAALVRGERYAWRPVVGLVVNVPVFLFVAYAVIVARANSGG